MIFGLHEGQLSWNGETLRIGSKSVSLGRVPLDGLQDELESILRQQNAQASAGWIRSQVRETILTLCDLTLTTSLQLLIDHYFGVHPIFEYTPRLLTDVQDKIRQLSALPFSLDRLTAGIALHETELLAARRLLLDLQSQFQTEERSGVPEDEGLSVYEC
jgi:hypothetical protein